MSDRAAILMTPAEVRAYVAEQKVIHVATIGPNGRPHLTPLWYYPHGDGVATWTYRSSQKAVNLRRLPQATVLIEDGESYDRLRGVSFEADVEIVEDPVKVTEMGLALAKRQIDIGPDEAPPDDLAEFIALQAAKRVGLIFAPTRVVSWDHGKLGGTH